MTDFSYQLYSSRNFPPLTETLKMLADLGYAQVEGYGALYASDDLVAELIANLDKSGLTMPTGHFGLDMLELDSAKVLQIAEALGIRKVYCPYIGPNDRPKDRDGYVAFGKRLQEAGKPFLDAGLGFGWHNHDFEFVALPDGSVPMDAILEGAPDLEWEADIAWVIKGGADVEKWIAEQGNRISAVHVKDIAPAGENANEDGWADVGHGTVDWPALMDRLKPLGIDYFVMEHDNPSDAKRFAERSIATAKTF
jgi:sugar phosphate isomerase/epimerase